MYVDYFRNEIENISGEVASNQLKKWNTFKANLFEGIEYYQNLLESTFYFKTDLNKIKEQFNFYKSELTEIKIPEKC
jgi:subtilase family serine protease